VALEEGTGWLLADDLEEVASPGPWVALLPALDPTAMGWTARDWYLGPHRVALFDRSGNIGPTVWAEGRIVGGWAQRGDGEILTRLLEDVGTAASAAIGAEAAALAAWLGDVRFKPRFGTPLERQLAGISVAIGPA
jgi:Winged helix DNA-binding domain